MPQLPLAIASKDCLYLATTDDSIRQLVVTSCITDLIENTMAGKMLAPL